MIGNQKKHNVKWDVMRTSQTCFFLLFSCLLRKESSQISLSFAVLAIVVSGSHFNQVRHSSNM